MPRLAKSIPAYRRHRASGQAVVTLAARDFYLGPYGSVASRAEYDRLISEWLAAGRPRYDPRQPAGLTISELCLAFWRHAKTIYKSGELCPLKSVLRLLRTHYGPTPAAEFGPLALDALLLKMVETGLARSTINAQLHRLRRVFKWGVSKQLVPVQVHQSLATVEGLRRGRTAARETEPRRPVPDVTVQATLPHLPAVVADMVRLQRLTGMRPGELCGMRPQDVDTTGEMWTYRPQSHRFHSAPQPHFE